MGDIGRLWQAAGNPALRTSFASSSTLAQQIEQGAPADVFASADEKWADELQQRGLLVAGTANRFADQQPGAGGPEIGRGAASRSTQGSI